MQEKIQQLIYIALRLKILLIRSILIKPVSFTNPKRKHSMTADMTIAQKYLVLDHSILFLVLQYTFILLQIRALK